MREFTERKREATDFRRFMEKEWYLNELFINGQYFYGVDKDNQLRQIEKRAGELRRSINYMRRYLKVMTRLITREDPSIEVKYSNIDKISDEIKEEMSIARHTLLQWYRNKKCRNMVTQVVKSALSKSFGAIELYWDQDSLKGLGDVNWKYLDTWSIWLDPQGSIDLQTGEFSGNYIIKEIFLNWSELEGSPHYDQTIIAGLRNRAIDKSDNFVKDNLTYIIYGYLPEYKDQVLVNVEYLRECEWQNVEDEKGEVMKKKVEKMKVIQRVGDIVIKEDYLPIYEYPIKFYYSEISPSGYPRPFMSDQRDPNKTINDVFSSMAEYSRTMLHGRVMVRDGTQLSTISTHSGQMVKWKGMQAPTELRMEGINASQFSLIDKAEQYQQNLAGVSDGTLGTGSATSGLEIELRKSADMENASEPATSLELFIQNVIRYTLALMVEYRVTTIPVEITDNGVEKMVNVISETSEVKPSSAKYLKMFDDIEIKVVPKSAFSDIALKQDLKELAAIGAIDRETLLDGFKVGVTADILERVRRAQAEAMGTDYEVEEARKESEEENELLMKGQLPKKWKKWKGDRSKLIAIQKHLEFAKQLIGTNNEKAKKAFAKHIQATALDYGLPLESLMSGQKKAPIDNQEQEI